MTEQQTTQHTGTSRPTAAQQHRAPSSTRPAECPTRRTVA